MKENYHISFTKREVDQLLKEMALAENIKEKQTKKFWERHEIIVEKIQIIVYQAKNPIDKA